MCCCHSGTGFCCQTLLHWFIRPCSTPSPCQDCDSVLDVSPVQLGFAMMALGFHKVQVQTTTLMQHSHPLSIGVPSSQMWAGDLRWLPWWHDWKCSQQCSSIWSRHRVLVQMLVHYNMLTSLPTTLEMMSTCRWQYVASKRPLGGESPANYQPGDPNFLS